MRQLGSTDTGGADARGCAVECEEVVRLLSEGGKGGEVGAYLGWGKVGPGTRARGDSATLEEGMLG